MHCAGLISILCGWNNHNTVFQDVFINTNVSMNAFEELVFFPNTSTVLWQLMNKDSERCVFSSWFCHYITRSWKTLLNYVSFRVLLCTIWVWITSSISSPNPNLLSYFIRIPAVFFSYCFLPLHCKDAITLRVNYFFLN